MNSLSCSCSKLRRFIAEHMGTTSASMSAAFWVAGGLAALTALSIFACSSPTPSMLTTPTPHRRLTATPTVTPTPTVSPTPTPMLLPPVTLQEPGDGAYLACQPDVTLRWSCPYGLRMGEAYQLSLRGSDSFLIYLGRDHFTLSGLLPGEYDWAVAVVRSTASDEYVPVSEESAWYSFEIVPPPVVHSISPTSTVRGNGVTVTISGENFTRSLALTIGVPLKATFVNSSTITATIPITLEAGEYPVVVKDPFGQGDSYASYVVMRESAPFPPQPASSPWNPTLPVPTAPPGYDPNVACVINPCAPAPQLIDPHDGTEFTINGSIELRWEWAYCLPPGWKFAIQISETSPPHSYHYEDNPKLISCENGMAVGRYRLPEDSRFRSTRGTYYWSIVVARSAEGGWERLSSFGEIRSFRVVNSP